MTQRMYDEIRDPELETLTQTELLRIEDAKLPGQLAHVFEKSPFYRKKMGALGLTPGNVVTNFSRIPFTEKQELLEDQVAHPPFGANLSVSMDQVQRVHRTSGTTG